MAPVLVADGSGRALHSEFAHTFFARLVKADVYEGDEPSLALSLLGDAARERATDIHLDPQQTGMRVRMRIDGVVYDVAHLTHEEADHLVNQFKALGDIDPIALFVPRVARYRCRVGEHDLDVRITAMPSVVGEAVAVRLLDPEAVHLRLGELGLSEDHQRHLEDWLDNLSGMFAVAGPNGSGKTTTLYTLLHTLKAHARRIVTIEDPVEYQLDGILQMQVDDRHHLDFAEGIRTLLRADPDYLLVGEMRDSPSVKVANYAAVSGRVVLTTMHSRDVCSAITTLRSYGLGDHQLASTLSVLMSQRLVRRLCAACARPQRLSELDRQWFDALGITPPETASYPFGCDMCRGTGYSGRTGVFEVWRLTAADRANILAGMDELALGEVLAKRGHVTLLDDAMAKLERGITSPEELRHLSSAMPIDSAAATV